MQSGDERDPLPITFAIGEGCKGEQIPVAGSISGLHLELLRRPKLKAALPPGRLNRLLGLGLADEIVGVYVKYRASHYPDL